MCARAYATCLANKSLTRPQTTLCSIATTTLASSRLERRCVREIPRPSPDSREILPALSAAFTPSSSPFQGRFSAETDPRHENRIRQHEVALQRLDSLFRGRARGIRNTESRSCGKFGNLEIPPSHYRGCFPAEFPTKMTNSRRMSEREPLRAGSALWRRILPNSGHPRLGSAFVSNWA